MKKYIFSFSGTIEIEAESQDEAYEQITNEELGKNTDLIECENIE